MNEEKAESKEPTEGKTLRDAALEAAGEAVAKIEAPGKFVVGEEILLKGHIFQVYSVKRNKLGLRRIRR